MAEPRVFSPREVHEFTTDAGGVRRLVASRPYVRLRRAPDQPAVYLWEGACWSETGERLDPPPKWVEGMVKGLTPAARVAVGFEPPGGPDAA